MPLILNIDTSTEHASLCLAEAGKSLCLLSNPTQRDHAAWLHPAIQEALQTAGKKMADLQAVGITGGPGSYTGLRVAMAGAKGLCYALNIPLIAVNTLEAMVYAALPQEADAFCPAIDARRMEVFAAVYNRHFQELFPPQNMVVEPGSFAGLLPDQRILFFGNGSAKMAPVICHPNAIFGDLPFNATHLAQAVFKRFEAGNFSSISLVEPLYLKEFYTTAKTVDTGPADG